MHFAVDGHGRRHRRDEDDVARQQLGVVAGVAAQQQVVQIEAADDGALALELDVAQRADRLDAAGGVQRRGDGREPADRIAAGTIRLAHDEHADRARVAHADAGAHADHLPRDALLDVGSDAARRCGRRR